MEELNEIVLANVFEMRGSGGRMDKALRSNPSGTGSNPGAADS